MSPNAGARANTIQLDNFVISHTRSGWNKTEEELLWKEVHSAREQGKALKSVFSSVAEKTGRKPNSIRNYYYAKAKSNGDDLTAPAFVPFKQEEIWELLVTVLSEQAKGVSVRYCTLKMGGGDNRAMLRYQNKYRSLIKTNPELVKQVVKYMKANNISCFDPYVNGVQTSARKVGRPRKNEENKADIISEVTSLVKTAAKADETKRRLEELQEELEKLREAGAAEAVAKMQAMEQEIARQAHTIAELLYALGQIGKAGRRFIESPCDKVKVEFAAELERCQGFGELAMA